MRFTPPDDHSGRAGSGKQCEQCALLCLNAGISVISRLRRLFFTGARVFAFARFRAWFFFAAVFLPRGIRDGAAAADDRVVMGVAVLRQPALDILCHRAVGPADRVARGVRAGGRSVPAVDTTLEAAVNDHMTAAAGR